MTQDKIKQIMIIRGWEETREDFDLPNGLHEDFPSFTNTGNSECIIPKAILEEIWKEAQKELLDEIRRDWKEGNPAEDIIKKYSKK